MDGQRLVDASRRLPPPPVATTAKSTLTAGASSAELALAIPGQWSFASGVAFSIVFSTTGMSAPTDTAEFPAGLYDFFVPPGTTFFRWTANAAGTMRYWRSGRASE